MVEFTFHISDFGVDLSHLCCICDANFITEDYERFSLDMDESSRAFICFFDNKIEAIAVIDYDLRYLLGEDDNTAVMMNLLCKTVDSDIVGAPKFLLNYINIMLYRDGKRVMYLKIAQEYFNTKAVNFYRKMGFAKHPPNLSSIYWYANIRGLLE